MLTGQLRHLAGIAGITVMGLGLAAPAHAANLHVVHPGESIQKAVDDAEPGDTIVILPGTYHESVLITVSDLTIRGAGESTVLTPGPDGSANACAQAGNGICVTGTADNKVTDVRIEALTVSGFNKSGIMGSDTDRMTVRDVLAENNGEHGIGQVNSTRGVLRDNRATNNGQGGIYLADAPDAQQATISGNYASGNRAGVQIRRARQLTIERNELTGNCGGVFVVSDGKDPKAGSLTIRGNDVYANNKYCPANARIPHIQGSGIILVGTEDTVVTDNTVRDHKGDSHLSGGIALVKSVSGGPSARNVIRDNVARNNVPADVADRDGGVENTFEGNQCAASEPTGRC